MTAPTVSQFLGDPDFLGNDFAGPSWDAWRITLKGAFGEPMDDAELARFRELASREPPPARVREAWFAIGRRGGKDCIVCGIATYAAIFGDFQHHLRRGEKAMILCLAVDRNQSGIVFNYIRLTSSRSRRCGRWCATSATRDRADQRHRDRRRHQQLPQYPRPHRGAGHPR